MINEYGTIDGVRIGRREKSCPSTTLSTTNAARSDLGLNLSYRGEKSATNRPNYFLKCS